MQQQEVLDWWYFLLISSLVNQLLLPAVKLLQNALAEEGIF